MEDNTSLWNDPNVSLDSSGNWIVASATDSANSPSTSTNSVWGSGLLTTINSLAGTGAQVYKTVNGKPKPVVTKTTATNFLPWIIGGVVVLILGAVLLRR